MDPWVAVGSGGALAIIALRCLGPHDWYRPSKWRIPDTGAAFLIFVGANSITEALKIGRLLVLGRIVISATHRNAATATTSLSADDVVFFIGGVTAGVIVGLISIRDGVGRLRP